MAKPTVRPPVQRIPPGVSGNPKRLDPNDPRNTPQMEGDMRRDKDYISPSTIDERPGPRGFEQGGAIKTRRGMKGVGGGREMIAGAIGDQLGNRLKARYEEEAMKKAVPPPQSPEDLPVPQFKHGGKVGNAVSYSKKFR